MFGLISRLFGRKPKDLDSVLKREGVTKEQLEQLGTLSFELEVNDINREKVSKLSEMKDVKIEKGSSQLMGGEVLSITASAITIIQALNWLGSRAVVMIPTSSGGKMRMSVKDVIKNLLDKAGGK